jgi:NDP-sugar pyrophosphorylase family protein
MIVHQVESLAAVGVTDIVLAVNYRPEVMKAAMKKVPLPRRAPGLFSQQRKSS